MGPLCVHAVQGERGTSAKSTLTLSEKYVCHDNILLTFRSYVGQRTPIDTAKVTAQSFLSTDRQRRLRFIHATCNKTLTTTTNCKKSRSIILGIVVISTTTTHSIIKHQNRT
jgi:hypothetical protein